MLARLSHQTSPGGARPDQVPLGFMRGVRHPGGRQFAGAEQLRLHHSVSPAFTGMSEGATTTQSCPKSASWRGPGS